MPEVMFVIKSLVVTVIIVLCLQIKMGPATAEDHVNDWLRTSAVTEYLREVAQGASLAIHNAAQMVSSFAADKFGGGVIPEKQEQASRLNFEFKRSQAYEKSKND